VIRHLRPEVFKRREQRRIEIPETGFNLFGDSTNPYAISPDEEAIEPEPTVLDLSTDLDLPAEPAPGTPRVLQMDDGLRAHFGNGASGEAETSNGTPAPAPAPAPRVAAMPKASAAKPAAPVPETLVPRPTGPTLVLNLVSLSANWPEEIRAEIAALDPATTVILPAAEVGTNLAKGRVSFTWRQIYSWLEPDRTTPSGQPGDTILQLPLKIVAPAFLASSKKPAAERKSFSVDESIPSLFNDGRPPEEKPAPPAPVAAPVESAPEVPKPVSEAAPIPAPESIHVPEPPAPPKLPETVSEIFRQPQKQTWTPAEIVAGTVTLDGVAGAVVALQEGLVVSASLPEGVKSEVVAAFLPQIFARLNQYAGEMRLGDVDDLLFTTHGAHCQIYRLGYVYFAVLGKTGESLPWHELRIITEELARHTHK
jgi:predicted regulator of Ras-like GTPase activity (Roadblock/LC7/MglB family)